MCSTDNETHTSPQLEERIRRVREILSRCDVEGIFFFGEANIRYLTGFTGSDGVLFLGTDRLVLLVDGRYTTQARREVACDISEFSDRTEGMARLIADRGVKRVGLESAIMTLRDYHAFKDRVDGIALKPLSGEIEHIRVVKDAGERKLLREAARIAAAALTEILGDISPGMAEWEIAVRLERAMRQGGGERPSFETIVASGSNSALPHATPGRREIREGDFVTIDYGTVWGGYHSDETCTVAVGEITEEQAAVYAVVREAHDRAIDRVRAGVPCRDIDTAARGHIDTAGYGDYFVHGTGHGVGLEVHESPRLSGRADDILEEGMVVTVEPGVYIPGRWGVRIEDTVMVGRDGCEILTRMSKDLKIL